MTDQFNPTEEQIARVIDMTKGDPRKLAIAYLRAQRRAQQSDLAFKVMADVAEMQSAAYGGDVEGAIKAGEQAMKDMRAGAQIFETEKAEGEK